MMKMKIYIVRHGETIGNKQGIYQGSIDTPLSELGIELANKTGEGLKDVKFDVAFSSPLNRALDTCKIILSKNKYKTPIISDNRLREVNMGTWEGTKFEGEDRIIPLSDIKKFVNNPFLLEEFPNGEKINDVIKRTNDFLFELVKQDYKTVLITTHGFALRALLNFMYENKNDFWQGHVPYNCAVNIIEYKNGQFSFIAKDKIYYESDKVIDRYKLK